MHGIYDESSRTATTGEPTCRPCYRYVQHWSSKTTVILRWSRTNTMGYGLVRLVCVVRKSHVGALKKIDFKGEKPAA